jgi:hypothetical protein
METILPSQKKKKKISTGARGKWRKWLPRFRLQQNKDKLYQVTQWSPQEHPERRNSANNQWEFHRDDIRHCQPKCTGGTQEIPR